MRRSEPLEFFTDKRLKAVNVPGATGRESDFTSLPYKRIYAFSVETAGTFNVDAEPNLWPSGMGSARLEFKPGVDTRGLGRMVGTSVL